MLPKKSAYVKSYDGQTKWMYFLIEMMTCQENRILFGIKSALISKKNLITSLSIKFHSDKITDFYYKKIPKGYSNYTCLAVISLHSALKKKENYYPQVFLKQCKYIEKKRIRHINDNLSGFYSSDESDKE